MKAFFLCTLGIALCTANASNAFAHTKVSTADLDNGLSEEARMELDALLNAPYDPGAFAEYNRKPAVLGPATEEPIGENAELYSDEILLKQSQVSEDSPAFTSRRR